MAVGGLALLKKVSMLMDDTAALVTKNGSKIASASLKSAKGVAAASPDDIAVRTTKISEVPAERELVVFFKIFMFALFVNKPLVLGAIFTLNLYAPMAIFPLLGLAGAYLAFEAFHVIYEFYEYKIKGKKITESSTVLTEGQMIKSTLISDFILSLELVVIALNPVMGEPVEVHITSVTLVIFFATIIVYLIVLFMLRLDNFALWLVRKSDGKGFFNSFGEKIIVSLPFVMKFITFVGTAAMVLLAGEIFLHFHVVHAFYMDYFHIVPQLVFEVLLGLMIGWFLFILVKGIMYPFKEAETITEH